MSVSLARSASPDLLEAVNHLIPQLSSSTGPMTAEQLKTFLDQDSVYLFTYEHEGRILGMLSLATFIIPTGLRAWIEDVVVDGEARGQGAGAQLVEEACRFANEMGARTVDLTSRPSREAANRLYRRCGFEVRNTNVYRYTHSLDRDD